LHCFPSLSNIMEFPFMHIAHVFSF
jgi:hypothetical protein